jgi:hypothetical protein
MGLRTLLVLLSEFTTSLLLSNLLFAFVDSVFLSEERSVESERCLINFHRQCFWRSADENIRASQQSGARATTRGASPNLFATVKLFPNVRRNSKIGASCVSSTHFLKNGYHSNPNQFAKRDIV